MSIQITTEKDWSFDGEDKSAPWSPRPRSPSYAATTSPLPKPEFLSSSFREMHYFCSYVVETCETVCLTLASRNPQWKLADHDWCMLKLDDPCREHPINNFNRSEIARKQWHKPGQIELDNWRFFFKKLGIPCCHRDVQSEIFSCLDLVRQAAIHRNHNVVSKDIVERAIRLPKVLQDEACAIEMRHVYKILLKAPANRTLEEENFLHEHIYTRDDQPSHLSQFMRKLQYLCEGSAFEYAKACDPQFLEEFSADCAERIELQKYYDRWSSSSSQVNPHPSYLREHLDPNGQRKEWQFALANIRDLRNEATHRSLSTDPELSDREILGKRVAWAVRFAKMVGDEEQAYKIPRIADEWFEKYRPLPEPHTQNEGSKDNTEEEQQNDEGKDKDEGEEAAAENRGQRER